MDGGIADWAAFSPVATDPAGDSSRGDNAEDILAAFVASDLEHVYFRLDIVDSEMAPNTPPTANSFTVANI